MPASLPQFTIEDAESVDQNLQRFGELLKQLDPELGAVLALNLPDLADREPSDLPSLWQSFFQSLIPAAVQDDAADGAEGGDPQ
uniref:Uncharacterized protein n=1 Tax=Rhizobium rhizogenes TaxID=359 RepID=A0A7S5DSR2_RHIRH|nr:hypothetical protein pC5.8a_160 [Rhizobium rhizogenes]